MKQATKLVYHLAYSLDLKMDATYFSETSVDFQRTTRHHITENRTIGPSGSSQSFSLYQCLDLAVTVDQESCLVLGYITVTNSWICEVTPFKVSWIWIGKIVEWNQKQVLIKWLDTEILLSIREVTVLPAVGVANMLFSACISVALMLLVSIYRNSCHITNQDHKFLK
jgi:hypothetical protein